MGWRKVCMAAVWLLFLGTLTASWWRIRTKTDGEREPIVEVAFLQTEGDADCIVLQNKTRGIMIDSAEEQDYERIAGYLEQKGIEELEWLIITHPDKDHIGSARLLAESGVVKKVMMPYYTKENQYKARLEQLCRDKNIPVVYPAKTQRIRMGDLQLLIYPPLEKNYENTNNYSLVVLAEHKKIKMVFAGDAEKKRTEELLHIKWPKTDLYKAAHHGRANAGTQDLVTALQPSNVVVTSDSADKILKDACSDINAKLFYTGEGTQLFLSDGETLRTISK